MAESKASQIRRDVINASYEAKACHIGSALSCVDLLVELLYKKVTADDIFIFGKASGVATYYAILADKGVFPKQKLVEYLKNYPLPSTEVPGIVHSFGSVGHALSVACGMALGDRTRKIYVLLSDGDLQEGSTYEAALFARQHKLTNLHVYVDDNKLIACGKTEDILSLTTAYDFFKKTIPNFTRVQTVKGAGIDFMEGSVDWHYRNLSWEERDNAICQIHG